MTSLSTHTHWAPPFYAFDESLFQATIESVQEGIVIVDQYGRMLYWNQQFIDMWEIPTEIISARNDHDLMNFLATKIKNADAFLTKVLQLYESPEKDFDTIIFKDGKVFERFSAPLIHSNVINGRVWSFKDVTAKKRLETQLVQAQKMEAIGTLAAGMAYDFNNILMVIQGYTSLLLMDDQNSKQSCNHLKEIQSHVNTAADLISRLLGFAGKNAFGLQRVDLKDLINRSTKICNPENNGMIITKSFDDGLWDIEADPAQIEQVIVNILDNARQALPDIGSIHIEAKNWFITEADQNIYHLIPGKYVNIGIKDTGKGMDQATQKRIFEPFFTTHEMGRGSGLGLATVYGIIKSHGGNIQVNSALGKGTEFMILLPVGKSDKIDLSDKKTEFSGGTETILIIDDEDMVLEVGTAMLTKMGYYVLTAENGVDAIKIYEAEAGNIDLVILDMVMPQMSGKESYEQLKNINPDVKVILSSGYSLNDQASEILDCGCVGFIQKPFNMSQLSQIISDALKK